MTNWLVRTFVKDYDNIKEEKIRGSYGTLSSIVGIICNIILFIVKYIMGTLANSIAIISDGFNNLSDSASCIITLFGYKMSAKPADKDHPFGHGRMEYLTSLVIAVIIIFVGIELGQSSIKKIINPGEVEYSTVVLVSLIISILLKIWMSVFNTTLGNKIKSSVMLATAQDSRNDVIITLASVVALLSSLFTDLPVDGVIGVIVSVFVLYSGYGIIKDTVDMLLGQPADPEMVEALKELVLANAHILGIHDLIIHNYGPGKLIGSAHVEVDSREDLLEVHDAVDQIEKAVYEKFKILMTLHMDPLELDNEFVNEHRDIMEQMVLEIHEKLSIHDFRVVTGPTHTNLIFDVLVPYECTYTDEYIKKCIDERVGKWEGTWYTVITFDRSYY